MFNNPLLAINGGRAICPEGIKRGKVFGEEERQAVWDVMDKGIISMAGVGDMVRRFEQSFAAYHRVPFAIATTSGTTALHTAIEALQIGPGDEVIVPDLTFISTASAVLQAGATVVFCDVDQTSFNISVEDLRSKITSKTKAVIVVHLYGAPADMVRIMPLIREFDIKLVEDCAQAHGAILNGQMVGTFGDLACYSFYQTKNMSCGEGGMIITDNENLARQCRSLTRHGLTSDNLGDYDYNRLGYNYSMTELQAAIGLVQLGKLDEFNLARCKNSAKYRSKLDGLDLRFQSQSVGHVNHCLTAVLPNYLATYRNWFIKAVRAEGATINCIYPVTLSRTQLFTERSNKPSISNQLASALFNFYTNPDITESFITICCEAVKKVMMAMKGDLQ